MAEQFSGALKLRGSIYKKAGSDQEESRAVWELSQGENPLLNTRVAAASNFPET